MNLAFDLNALLIGFALGIPISALFFLGLGWGINLALKSKSTGWLLLFSFIVRATLLVGVVWLLIQWLQPIWAVTGFMLAFILVRRLMTRRVKAQQAKLEELAQIQPLEK